MGKRVQNGYKKGFLDFLKNVVISFSWSQSKMENSFVVDMSPPIPYLAKFCFSSNGSKCCQPIKLQDSWKCNISEEKSVMNFIFGIQININVFYKLIILSFRVCATRHAQNTQNKKFAYLCNISRKAWRVKLIFCLQINRKVFYKLIVSLWVCLARYAQRTQNKFTISL